MQKRRISSYPRFLDCPSSAVEVDEVYDAPNEAADEGTAAHKALQILADGGTPDIEAITKHYNVDYSEVQRVYNYGVQAMRELAKIMPEMTPECRLEGKDEKGTADLVYIGHDSIVINDWKTNRVKRDYMDQVRGYAKAAYDEFGMPECGFITVAVTWLRFGEIDIQHMHQADIDAFQRRIDDANERVGKSYSPGKSCEFCPRQMECGYRTKYIQASSLALAQTDFEALTREQIGDLYDQAKVVKGAVAHYDKILKMLAKEEPIPLLGGRTVKVIEELHDQIDPVQAWPILQEAGFNDDDLAGCVSMGKGKIKKAIESKSSKGHKKKDSDRLFSLLRDAGACTKKTVEKLKVS